MLRRIIRWRQWRKLTKRIEQCGLSTCVDGLTNWVNDSPKVYRAMYNVDLDEYVEHLIGTTAMTAPRHAVIENLKLLHRMYAQADDVRPKIEALVYIVIYAASFTHSLASDPTGVLLNYLRSVC